MAEHRKAPRQGNTYWLPERHNIMAPRKPMAVVNAEAEANQIIANLQAGKDPMAPVEGTPPAAPETTEPIETPPGLPPLGATEQKPAAPAEPQTPAEPAAPPATPSETDTLREQLNKVTHSLSVLEGKYNAEVPRLHEQNRLLAEENQRLKAAPQEPQTPAELADDVKEAVDSIRETYGDKLADQFVTIAKGFSTKAPEIDLSQYDGKISEISSELNSIKESQTKSAEDQYFDWLDKNIPGWQQVNVDPKFHQWLNGVAPYSGGKTYSQILTDSHASRQGSVVKEIFDAFSAQFTPETPAGAQHLQVPDTTGGGHFAAQQAATGRMWKESEVSAVYNAKIKGELTDQQFAAYEAEIHQAGLEGRIIQGQ